MSSDNITQDSGLYTYEYFLQDNICRFCWNCNADEAIFSESDEDNKSEVMIKIRECLDIEIQHGSIPRYACKNCIDQIEKFYDFKVFCKESDKRLREILNKCGDKTSVHSDINNSCNNIKIETDIPNLKKTDSLDSIWENLQDSDDNEPLENQRKKNVNLRKKYVPKRSPTYCNICCIDLQNKEQFSLHNAQSHGIEKDGFYKCFGCEKRFQSRKSRLGHEINYCKGLKDGYKCMKCERYLPKRRMYEAHMRDHRDKVSIELPEDLFKCYKCNKLLKTRDSLKTHMTAHETEKKNFVCESCGRVFTRQDYLYKHKLTHTGTKEHVCSQCGFRATQRSSLVVHMRKHTGERPYSCDMCPQRCISSSNLRAHRMRHLGLKKYQCKICNKKFGYKISLDEHVGSVHERSESHTCELCGAVYTRHRGLKRHLLSKHRNKKSETNGDIKNDFQKNIQKDCVNVI